MTADLVDESSQAETDCPAAHFRFIHSPAVGRLARLRLLAILPIGV